MQKSQPIGIGKGHRHPLTVSPSSIVGPAQGAFTQVAALRPQSHAEKNMSP